MTWQKLCEHVVSPYLEPMEDVKVAGQTYYGRLLAVNGICELVTSQFVGVASDKHGRRPVQVVAQLGQVPWMVLRESHQEKPFSHFLTSHQMNTKFGDMLRRWHACPTLEDSSDRRGPDRSFFRSLTTS